MSVIFLILIKQWKEEKEAINYNTQYNLQFFYFQGKEIIYLNMEMLKK